MRTVPGRVAGLAALLLLLALIPAVASAQSPAPTAGPSMGAAVMDPVASGAGSGPDASTPPSPSPMASTAPRRLPDPGTDAAGPAAVAPVVTINIVPAWTRVLTVSIKLPTTDPTGSGIKAWYVSEDPVTPTLGATGWRTIKPTTFRLSPGEGVHTVYAWARSNSGARSAASSDTVTVDRTAPVVGLTGPETSSARVIPIVLSSSDPPSGPMEPASGVTRWAVVAGTTAPGVHATAWKTAPPTTFRLPRGNGLKTVSAFVRDAAGNVSAAATITVVLQVAGPTVALTMPVATTSRTARLTVTSTDPGGTGIAGYLVSTSGVLPTGPITWLAQPTTITLPAGDGPKTVYAWAKDNNGTISDRAEAVTVLDTTKPLVTMSAPPATSSIELPVLVSATDGGSGVDAYAVVNGTAVPARASGAWQAEPPTSLVLSYGNGTRTFTAYARDAAGNISAPVTLTVAMDVPAPIITAFTMPVWTKARQTAVTVTVSDPGGTGVAGYFLSESGTAPSASAPGWVIAATTVTLADVQGLHTVHAWVKDRNGSVSGVATTTTSLDTIKPVVTLSAPVATRPSTIDVSLATIDTGSGVAQWTVVNGTTAPATGFPQWVGVPPTTFTLPGGDGARTISAFVRDIAGNVSVASTRVVIVDNARPLATLMAPAATDVAAIGISVGGTDAASGVVAYAVVDGTTAPADGSPLWSATPQASWTLPIGDAHRTISAFVRDAAGNVSAAASAEVILDTTAPSVLLTTPAWWNGTTPWVAISENDFGGVGVTHWAVVSGTIQPGPASAAWVATRPASVTVGAGDGSKTVSAWSRDALGHVSAIHTRTIVIDTVPPSVSLGQLPDRTSTRTIAIALTGDDDASGVVRWAVTEGTSAPSAGSSAWRATAPMSYAIAGAEGTRTIRAWTRDAAGNVSAPAVRTIFLDTVAPSITFTTPAVATVRGITLSISGSDGSGSGITGWAVVEGAAQPAASDPAWSGSPTTSFTLADAEGSTQITVFCRDLAGNVGSVTRSVVLDRVAPGASLLATSPSASRTVAVTVGGSDGALGSGITGFVVVEGTAAPAVDAPSWGSSPPSTFQVTAGDGVKTLTAFTKDAAGHVSSGATATVLLDTTRPTAQLSAPATTTVLTIAVTVSGSDLGSGLAGYIVLEGSAAPAPGAPGWSVSAPTAFTLAPGQGPRTVSAFTKDHAGNVSLAATTSITVDPAP